MFARKYTPKTNDTKNVTIAPMKLWMVESVNETMDGVHSLILLSIASAMVSIPVSALSKILFRIGMDSILTSFQKCSSVAKFLNDETIREIAFISSGTTSPMISARNRTRNNIERKIEMTLLCEAMNFFFDEEICFSKKLAGIFITKAMHIPLKSGIRTADAFSVIHGSVVL